LLIKLVFTMPPRVGDEPGRFAPVGIILLRGYSSNSRLQERVD
jgi:hypothetical protein